MNELVRKLLEEKFGRKIRYPKDCESLALQMNEAATQRISASTLKRLFGFITPTTSPSLYTLDTVAMFLGFADWESLQIQLMQQSDSTFSGSISDIIRSEDIKPGTILEIGYARSKTITIQCTMPNEYIVIKSENSSLKENDHLHISVMAVNYPLMVGKVTRDLLSLGPYIAGKRNGVDFIRILN